MKPPKSATRKTEWLARAAAATALIWAVLGVLWAQVILLPHPLLPPPSFAELLGRVPATTRPDRFIVMLFKETSLLLTAYALLGMLMCTLAGRAGARKTLLLATLLCVTIAVASLVPVAQATKTSSAEGVPLSLTGYFADLAPVQERFADRFSGLLRIAPYCAPGGFRVVSPPPFRCPLLSKLSCVLSPVGGGSRVFTVRLDYVETPLGRARLITQAVDKVQGGSCG
jgi:hypothetical protein